jgi:hypothetical protein
VSDSIFFTFIFSVLIEAIIELLIISYFNYKTPNYNSIGEVLGISQSYFCLIMLVMIMPMINIFLLIIAHRNIEALADETILNMFGAFYKYFKNRKAGLLYQLIYFIRRDVFIVTSFML